MNKLVSLVAVLMVVGSFAVAADTVKDNSGEDKTTTSKNVLTGTKTTKHKMKKHTKDAAGQGTDATVTETTKEKTDGTVKKSVEVDATKTEKK